MQNKVVFYQGWGIELSPVYFLDGAQYCAQADRQREAPSLFDFIEEEEIEETDLIEELRS